MSRVWGSPIRILLREYALEKVPDLKGDDDEELDRLATGIVMVLRDRLWQRNP